METRENTLGERERQILSALLNDADEVARRRARVLLAWADGRAPKAIAQDLVVRTAQVHKLIRAFLQNRLEVFPPPSLERALRGISGMTTVEALLRQHPADLAHLAHVTSLALHLFDATQAVHQIPLTWRRVLEAGARLHNLGSHLDADARHPRRAHDLILAHDLAGFTPQERDVIACLALFHRKKVKPDQDALFATLDHETQRITLALTAILRVADALDSTKTQTTTIAAVTCDSVVDVLVVGEGAERNAARANKKADVWRAWLAPPLVVRADRERPPAPIARPKPSLSSELFLGDAARQILGHQLSKLRGFEPDVRAGDNFEAVHDMRVACRRTVSALRLFRPYLPAKRVKKLRPILEELRDLLGAARNLDVLLADLDAYCASAPEQDRAGLRPVVEAWQEKRGDLQHALVELLDSPEYQEWCARFETFLTAPDDRTTPRVADVVPALIWKQYGAARAYETIFGVASLEELHALRIDLKRLRYTLEFFRELLNGHKGGGERAALLIEPLVALQDRLGAIQDAVVAGKALTDFIAAQARHAKHAGESVPEFQAVAAYHAHLQAHIAALRAGLRDAWHVIMRPAYREQLALATAAI